MEPDLSEEVSARLRLGSGSNGLLMRKVSVLEAKEKNFPSREKERRSDLFELTEVWFLCGSAHVSKLKHMLCFEEFLWIRTEYMKLKKKRSGL